MFAQESPIGPPVLLERCRLIAGRAQRTPEALSLFLVAPRPGTAPTDRPHSSCFLNMPDRSMVSGTARPSRPSSVVPQIVLFALCILTLVVGLSG